jgi:hypothetical protein
MQAPSRDRRGDRGCGVTPMRQWRRPYSHFPLCASETPACWRMQSLP